MIRFGIPPEAPYLLHQLQDAFNSVSEALLELSVREDSYEYRSAEEVARVGTVVYHGELTDIGVKHHFTLSGGNQHIQNCRPFEFQLMQPVMSHLMRARTTLTIPRKRTFEELKCPAHRRHFVPPLPLDMSASFYIQAHKMIFALYQVLPNAQNFNCFQVRTVSSKRSTFNGRF